MIAPLSLKTKRRSYSQCQLIQCDHRAYIDDGLRLKRRPATDRLAKRPMNGIHRASADSNKGPNRRLEASFLAAKLNSSDKRAWRKAGAAPPPSSMKQLANL
jgi:hypothetical protein